MGYLLKAKCGYRVDIDEYYMDTAYNSDPEKFEVKQVLLNVNLKS